MSDRREEPPRQWRCYARDMIAFSEEALAYIDGLNRNDFQEDRKTYDAVWAKLVVLGEAAANIPDEIRARHPEIPWRTIVATRNRLIHGYPVVEEGVVWQTVTEDLPELVVALRRLLKEEREVPPI